MKTAIINEIEIKIPNKIYDKLLERFDVKNYNYDEFDGYWNYKVCPLCEKYNNNNGCKKCPITKLYPDLNFSCVRLIEEKICKFRNKSINLYEDCVEYKGRTGKNQIKKIHKWLLENFK